MKIELNPIPVPLPLENRRDFVNRRTFEMWWTIVTHWLALRAYLLSVCDEESEEEDEHAGSV
jgi:hypothetical protein